MEICNELNEDHIFLGLKAKTKSDVLKDLVDALKKRDLITNEEVVLDELIKREKLGSTGLEKGIAIPHALTEEVENSLFAVAVIKEGINYEAVDQLPTDVLFLLLGNKNNPGLQLKVLAHVCRLIKETDLVEKIRKAKTPQKVCEIFKEEEEKVG